MQLLGALGVLGGDEQLLDPHRPPVGVADASPGSCRPGADRPACRPCAPRRAARPSRWASAIGSGMSSGVSLRRVAEHHPLVARAGRRRTHRRAALAGGPRRRASTPWAMSGDCLSTALSTAQESALKPSDGVGVADPPDRLARDVLDVERRRRRDLAGDDDQPGVDERLAGHARRGGPGRARRRGRRRRSGRRSCPGGPRSPIRR